MFSSLKGAASRIPIIGPAFKNAYLKWFAGEGKAFPIRGGHLAGMRYYRYRWSTPREDLVETNWEDESAGAFVRLIKGKKRVFDVGANWGFYVLLAHKNRDPGCEIIALEPHPQSAKELKTQITLNQIDNAKVVAAAMSNQVGTMEFLDTGSAIGQKLAVLNGHTKEARRIQVPTITLDQAAREYGPPDLVKLDVEGAENLVLQGGQQVLTQIRPQMVIEVHGEERSGPFYELMKQYNYRCQTPSGLLIEDGSYHHQVVAIPR